MRGERTFSLVALSLCLGVMTAGCSGARQSAEASAPPVASGPAKRVAAPTDPDLASVMERFYQQVEGQHWKFAYAMLTPRYRAALSESAFQDRYIDLSNPDVQLQQKTDRVVVARLDARDVTHRTQRHTFEETVTLAWNGEQWEIDDISRRDVSADKG